MIWKRKSLRHFRSALFEGLTAVEIEGALTAVGYSLVRLDKNDIYAFTGSRCLYADIVVEGEMTARMVGPSGKFVQMADLRPSALLAPAFIFSKDNRMPVSIETNKATTILRMRPTQLKEMMVNDDRILMNFVGQLSDTSSFLTKKVRMLTLLRTREGRRFSVQRIQRTSVKYIHTHSVAAGDCRFVCDTEVFAATLSQRVCR